MIAKIIKPTVNEIINKTNKQHIVPRVQAVIKQLTVFDIFLLVDYTLKMNNKD
jgi:hypothetical protein